MLKRGIVIFIILILSLGFVSASWLDELFTGKTVAAGIYSKSVNEGNQLSLNCGYGEKIQIRTVDYCSSGDSNKCNICPELKEKCHNKRSCVFWPSNDNCNGIPKDPHYGVRKNLRVTYDCIDESTPSTTTPSTSSESGTYTRIGYENNYLSVDCGSGKKIQIKTMRYGKLGLNNQCPKVKEECENEQSCSVRITNDNCGGDPIYGISKDWTVTYNCVDGSGTTQYVCLGSVPSHVTICEEDDEGLTGITYNLLVSECSNSRKCEYRCNNGYSKSGNSCVVDTTPLTTSSGGSGGGSVGSGGTSGGGSQGPTVEQIQGCLDRATKAQKIECILNLIV